MVIKVQNGLVKAKQLDLRTLIPVPEFLRSRGFAVREEGSTQATILPRENDLWSTEEANTVFRVFNDPYCRTELKHFISGTLESSLSETVAELTNLSGFRRDSQAFTATFEWYVSELMIRKFSAFSASFSVKVEDILRNSNNGQAGDYDVLSVLRDMQLLYIECKSGRFDSKHILKAVERGLALHCVRSVILTGTDISEDKLRSEL